MKTRKRTLGLISAIALALYMGLGACVAGIQEHIPNGNGGNGNGGVTLPPPVVTQVHDTRATIEVEVPPEVTDTPDSFGISVDGRPSESFTCGSPCQYIVPNLDPERLYPVQVTYTITDQTSLPGDGTIDTSFHVASYTGYAPGTFYGTTLAIGDVNGDGNDEILVGPGDNTPLPRIVDLFRLGPEYFPADAGDGLVPYRSFDDSLGFATSGYQIGIGDVNCDGISDILIGEAIGDALQGTIFVFRGSSTLAPGDYDLRANHDFYLTFGVVPDSRFSYAFAPFDRDGTNCDSLIIGAYHYEAIVLGAVFEQIGPVDANVIFNIGDIIYAGTAPGDQAGLIVKDVGDVDGDGRDEVIFAASYTIGALPNTWDVDFMFSDNIGVTYGTFTVYNDGSPDSHTVKAGSVGPERFYISYGINATSAAVNLYDQRASIIPENQIINGTDRAFGMGGDYGNLYPDTDGIELVIGSYNTIYVYNDFTVGADFDVTVDVTLPGFHGENLKLIDANNDGYLDIVATDHTFDGNRGALFIYY